MIPSIPVDTHVAFAKEITRKHVSGVAPMQRTMAQPKPIKVRNNRLFNRLTEILEKVRRQEPMPAS